MPGVLSEILLFSGTARLQTEKHVTVLGIFMVKSAELAGQGRAA
jgi:hypothetical protein